MAGMVRMANLISLKFHRASKAKEPGPGPLCLSWQGRREVLPHFAWLGNRLRLHDGARGAQDSPAKVAGSG